MNETEKLFGNTISTYSDLEAVEDGILVDVAIFEQGWEEGLFDKITTNLLESEGYIKIGYKMNLPNIMDLLNQANQIVKKSSDNFKNFDHFFSGKVELPSGDQEEIFIVQNESGKFTIMLPGDY